MTWAIAALDRKVIRDAARMRGQLVAIAVVIACGLGIFVAMRATMRSLLVARSHYYARERFGERATNRGLHGIAHRVADHRNDRVADRGGN